MQEEDKRSIAAFLDILENRLAMSVADEYRLIPERYKASVYQAWERVRPNIITIRETILSLNLREYGLRFDQHGLSGHELQLKLTLVLAAEQLILRFERRPDHPFRDFSKLRIFSIGPKLVGLMVGLMIGLFNALFWILLQPDPRNIHPDKLVRLVMLIYVGGGMGLFTGWAIDIWRRWKQRLPEKSAHLRKLLQHFLKPANTILGSMASALNQLPFQQSFFVPGPMGAGALTEGLKEFKDSIEAAMDHQDLNLDKSTTETRT